MITGGITSAARTQPTAAAPLVSAPPAGMAPAAEPAASPASDTATLSGAAAPAANPPPSAPTTNPWAELERLGLMDAGNVHGGPLGQTLSQVARQGLLDALVRLEAHGVSFERERRFYIPGLMDHFVPRTAEQVVTLLERKSADRAQVTFNEEGKAHRRIWGVDDLRALDVARGLGAEALKPEDRNAYDALADLTASGWIPKTEDYYSKDDGTSYDMWRALGHHHPIRLSPPGGGAAAVIRSPQDLVTLGFLVSGRDRGVTDRALADALVTLDAEKPRYNTGSQDGEGPLDAYRALTVQGRLEVSFPGQPTAMPVTRADFSAPAGIVERSRQMGSLWQKYLKPVMGDSPYYAAPYLNFCTEPGGRFSPELRGAATAHLMRFWTNAARDSAQLIDVVRRLEGTAADDIQMAWMVNRVADVARREGCEGALAMVDALVDGTSSRAASPSEAARLRPTLFTLIEATRSVSTALEGLDLVRVAVGDETEEQRLRLFTDIAARESEKTLQDTAADYRTVLVHRRPGETLVEAGSTFVRVLELLGLGRQQERAREVFAVLQEGMKTGAYGRRGMDDVLAEFGQAMTMARSVDDALRAISGSRTGAGTGPGSVETRDDEVVIGGIRVPRSRKSEA